MRFGAQFVTLYGEAAWGWRDSPRPKAGWGTKAFVSGSGGWARRRLATGLEVGRFVPGGELLHPSPLRPAPNNRVKNQEYEKMPRDRLLSSGIGREKATPFLGLD